MDDSFLNSFLRLSRSNRQSWITSFLDEPWGCEGRAGLRFPGPLPQQTAADFLIATYESHASDNDLQEAIRNAVVDLLLSECKNLAPQQPYRVLGRLMRIAGELRFTEVGAKLFYWIAADAFREARFADASQTYSLRLLAWNQVLLWNPSSALIVYLCRDLEREDCAAMCFQAIAKLDPGMAITKIPRILKLPSARWRVLLTDFLRSLTVETALDDHFAAHWQTCLSHMIQDDALRYHLEDLPPSVHSSEFMTVLRAIGIRCIYNNGDRRVAELVSLGGSAKLTLALHPPNPRRVEESVIDRSQRIWRGHASPGYSLQALSEVGIVDFSTGKGNPP